VPARIPVITPEIEPIVPDAATLLLHVPPDGLLLNVVVAPSHTIADPNNADGRGFTVTIAVRKHPAPALLVYVIVTVFADTPVTTPVLEVTEPISGLLLAQAPPEGPLLSVVVNPWQTDIAPVITDVAGLTVMVINVRQPVGNI
jgi:hypothetical protein